MDFPQLIINGEEVEPIISLNPIEKIDSNIPNENQNNEDEIPRLITELESLDLNSLEYILNHFKNKTEIKPKSEFISFDSKEENIEPLSVMVIGDPHFKDSNVAESRQMTKALIKIANEKNPDLIICLGDILDKHEKIHVEALCNANDMLAKLKNIAPLVIIIGNHDRRNNSDFMTNIHPFTAMKEWNNTYVVDYTLQFYIKGHKLIFVPYVPNGDFQSALSVVNDWNINTTCIFAHQEFYGCQMGHVLSLEGDKWSVDYPMVISGHIHDYQRLQQNILYTGTPLQHGFGDLDTKTICYIDFTLAEDLGIDLTDNNVTNNGVYMDEERIDLGLIKRVTNYITPQQLIDYEPDTDKIIRLVIKGTEAETKSIRHSVFIDKLKEKGVKVVIKTVREKNTIDVENNGNNDQGDFFSVKTNNRLPYLIQLYHKAVQENNVQEWYHKLFGRPQGITDLKIEINSIIDMGSGVGISNTESQNIAMDFFS